MHGITLQSWERIVVLGSVFGEAAITVLAVVFCAGYQNHRQPIRLKYWFLGNGIVAVPLVFILSRQITGVLFAMAVCLSVICGTYIAGVIAEGNCDV